MFFRVIVKHSNKYSSTSLNAAIQEVHITIRTIHVIMYVKEVFSFTQLDVMVKFI